MIMLLPASTLGSEIVLPRPAMGCSEGASAALTPPTRKRGAATISPKGWAMPSARALVLRIEPQEASRPSASIAIAIRSQERPLPQGARQVIPVGSGRGSRDAEVSSTSAHGALIPAADVRQLGSANRAFAVAGQASARVGHPDAHGSDAGGNLTKQGAPVMLVEAQHLIPFTSVAWRLRSWIAADDTVRLPAVARSSDRSAMGKLGSTPPQRSFFDPAFNARMHWPATTTLVASFPFPTEAA